jgi:hypothetical protein
MKNTNSLAVIFIVMICAVAIYGSDPANMSLRGLIDWTTIGGHIASGTGALPAVATEGARYTDVSTPATPLDYRSTNGAWALITGGTSSGVSTHSELTNLDYDSSGHTGFASPADIPGNASFTLNGLSDAPARAGEAYKVLAVNGAESGYEWVVATSGSGVATHSDLGNLDFSNAGHTGFASSGVALAVTASEANHEADTVDPHGANPVFTETITIGSGTVDAAISRTGTATITIASYVRLLPIIASPSGDTSTGTLWMDATGTVYIYRNATWQTAF